ncbi:uncharacterized protein M421DRAFT_2271 [Didymella exigua CBS 183.55]|uniref:Uncharacterized protein n=1 Tax=Didymella exigua CBS 183.55 TaxID=1150837 RepID=A0A6A5RUS9_9PLEO|nr:uncharacterized protein M421DRAFT_2271 [Didymella exigua CBS 183.55]KAF1931622.1 hypothetical protein M421DRAFT_2271 [Didymella exigua CBS 183.55]
MFNFSGQLLAGQHDTQQARPPPAKPIPATFPVLDPPKPLTGTPPETWCRENVTGITKHFLSLKKPSDVTKETLAQLNVTFQLDCDFETILSSLSNDAVRHIPPASWLDAPDQQEPSNLGSIVTLLSNGRRVPDRKEFFVRARELLFKNEDAFSTLTRKSTGGQVPLRLAYFRKFWEGLDNMAYYWDDSLDEYHPPESEAADTTAGTDGSPKQVAGASGQETRTEIKTDWIAKMGSGVGSPDESEPRKKAKTEAVSDQTMARSVQTNGFGGSNAAQTVSITPSRVLPSRIAPPRFPTPKNMEPQVKPADMSDGSYRGYRIGNGSEMPDQYRVDCVRAFVEPIAWAFGVTLAQHRRPPVLLFEHVRFPVRMSSVAWRGPQDRMKARQGWMEGPVLGIQCRPDVNFGASSNIDAASNLDAIRELGGLLLLAQERSREGKVEKLAGEGKWWTTKERWGGGPGDEIDNVTTPSVISGIGAAPNAQEKSVHRNVDGSRVRRRPTPAQVWKVVKPGNPLWDPKVVFEAIGRDESKEWDDVFMVSSLNHHISLLKLHVHSAYLDYITHGTLPESRPSDPDWCSPKLERTRWFDLFNVDDRTEAMRGLWGVMSYLLRAKDGSQEDIVMGSS